MLFKFFVPGGAHSGATCLVRGVVCAMLSGLLALSFPTLAAGRSLTLADAQRRAIERSRQLAAQDFAVVAARESAVSAAQLPDPVLSAGIDNLPLSGTDRFSLSGDFMTMRRIGVTQEITRADKRQLRAERFEREAQKTLAEKSTMAAAIERDTALAWLDRYYAEAMATAVAEQGAQSKIEIEAAEGAYRAGRGSQADLLAARGALAAFDDRASEIGRRVRAATTALARWIGDAANLPLGEKPDTAALNLNPAGLDTQLSHHPQIAKLQRQEELAATEVALARADQSADWSVGVSYQQRGPSYPNMLSFGVSIPLQWNQRNRQDRELAAKLALAEQAGAEREERLREHVAETRAMLDEWDNDRERAARYRREILPLAEQRSAAALDAYRGGKGSLAEVLAARRNAIELRIQALQLQADADRLWAQLNFLFPSSGAVAPDVIFPNKESK